MKKVFKQSYELFSISDYQNHIEILEEYNKDNSDERDINLKVRQLSLISGLPEDEFLKLSHQELIEKCFYLKFLKKEIPTRPLKKYYKIGKRKYRLHTNVSELVESEFRQLMKLTSDIPVEKMFENLHLIISTLLVPVKFKIYRNKEIEYDEIDHLEESEYIRNNFSIVDANSIMVFFYQKFPNFIKLLMEQSEIEMTKSNNPAMLKQLNELKKIKMDLKNFGIGI